MPVHSAENYLRFLVSVRAYGYPYGGYVTSTILTNEKLVVGENGEINDSIAFDETFYEQHKIEPIRLELRFDPSSISSLHEKSDELQSIYGETGEKMGRSICRLNISR